MFDQKNGPSGWKFTDGSSNKLKAGTKVPLSDEQLKYVTEKNRMDKKRKLEGGSNSTDSTKKSKNKTSDEPSSTKNVKKTIENTTIKAPSIPAPHSVDGVHIETIKASSETGGGATATRGKRVRVHYIGKLSSNGRVFDSSSSPFGFKLGAGEVIRGW